MSTAPVKSQPLHNFTLPQLKWGHKSHQTSSSNHRFRHRDSPSPEGGESEENISATTTTATATATITTKLQTGPRTARNHLQRFSFSPCSSRQETPQQDQNDVVNVSQRDNSTEKEPLWNLRPRKQVNFGSETVSFADVDRVERNAENNEGRPSRLRGGHGEGTGLMKHKPKPEPGPRKLWISLSREEIEEDVYALTGSRPSRRPKKRPKTVQKQVDSVFPDAGSIGDWEASRVLHYDGPLDVLRDVVWQY